MMRLLLSLCVLLPLSLPGQIAFLGFADQVKESTDVIFNSSNFGKINVADKIYLLDASAIYELQVASIHSDSVRDKNFIGGNYINEKGSLCYFDRRLRATYQKTRLLEDYLLTRDLIDFLHKTRLRLVFSFSENLEGIEFLQTESVSLGDDSFDLVRWEKQGKDGQTAALTSFLKMRIKLKDYHELYLFENKSSNGRRSYVVFYDDTKIAEILISLKG